MDEKLKNVAKTMVDYSLKLESGQSVYLRVLGKDQFPLAVAVKEYCQEKGIRVEGKSETMTMGHNDEMWRKMTPWGLAKLIKSAGAIIDDNDATLSLREDSTQVLKGYPFHARQVFIRKVLDGKILKKRWCLTTVPTREFAQRNGVDYDELMETYIRACGMDYDKMNQALKPLAERMAATDRVKIIAPNTDLEFSIKGMAHEICAGNMNLPDGEIFTAPVKTSVNGHVQFNAPHLDNGTKHENIYLEFRDGKIIKESSTNTTQLTKTLNSDKGARYIGEFALGVNPHITKPVGDTLYDEKIAGSFHLTPGNCYDEVPNGNKSGIHEDLVQIQTPEFGGGEIYFDGKLIRKDGIFVPEDLHGLNTL